MKLLIIDSAVSLSPKSWLKYKSVKQYYDKFKRMPLINASIHQSFLKNIPREKRLDRPDILHFGLLTALGYQLLIPDLEVIFNIGDKYFLVDKNTHIPRSQSRFYGIVEQLLMDPNSNPHIHKINFDINTKKIVFTRSGISYNQLINSNIYNTSINTENFTINTTELFIFGGFSTGYFRTKFGPETLYLSLSQYSLELWTAISLFLNKYMLSKSSKQNIE